MQQPQGYQSFAKENQRSLADKRFFQGKSFILYLYLQMHMPEADLRYKADELHRRMHS